MPLLSAPRRRPAAGGHPFRKIDINRDPKAAAHLRTLIGGDEVTPTMIINGNVLINPDVAAIRSALAQV
ncbi:glutaredoxin family protein [Nocardia sp. CWNU-33]|uniref:glutaredoxin family protein n=1 Tax=Nocardia sp. CWNU-33 TaxID=3392117 RepID=UPI00398E407D